MYGYEHTGREQYSMNMDIFYSETFKVDTK